MAASLEALRYRLQPADWQAITKFFPHSTFDSDQKSWRVTGFLGDTISVRELQSAISRQVDRLEKIRIGAVAAPTVSASVQISALEQLAAKYGVSLGGPTKGSGAPAFVDSSRIRIVSPIQATVSFYPRGLRCDKCGFYAIMTDFKRLNSLKCKDCGSSPMRQVSLVFVCPECGSQEEMRPPWRSIEREGPIFACKEEGCHGHYRLELHREALGDSRWVCSEKDTHKEPVMFWCGTCLDANHKHRKMELKATTATYLKPLVLSVVYVGDNQPINIETLEPTKKLSADLSFDEEKREVLSEFGVEDVLVIDDVSAYTAVYGYTTYKPGAKAQFFLRRNPDTNQYEYMAYVTQSKGKGLIAVLEKRRICRTALTGLIRELERANPTSDLLFEAKEQLGSIEGDKEVDETYAWLVSQTKVQLDAITSEEEEKLVPLFQLLHSIEHALTYQATLQTGLEEGSFVGKVLLDACAVLIYEQENVEAGGVDYLYSDRLARWLAGAIKHVSECRYECSDGCVKCLFVHDPLCHPFMPTDVPSTYVFPNSMLSRALLRDFWQVEMRIADAAEAKGGDAESEETDSSVERTRA